MKIKNFKQEILEMAEQDQSLRNRYFQTFNEEDFSNIKKADKKNRKRFKEIFEKVGYISSKQEKDLHLAAFLIVQHMPKEEYSFMKKYLSFMKDDLEHINPLNYAQLVDRVRIYEGKKQMYGTQFELVNKEENIYKLKEIYDFKNIDKRREEIGLKPLSTYIKELEGERGIKVMV